MNMQNSAALGAIASGSALYGAAALTYAVRGRASQFFGPSVYRGPRSSPGIAVTFDDGPSEGTLPLLETLSRFNIPATFFQCGLNVQRLPDIAREVVGAGHEIGNHSHTHPALYFRSAAAIESEFVTAQRTIEDALGVTPSLMRAPFGARWFGFRRMQARLRLLGVMWTVIGLDWKLDAASITARVMSRVRNGAIICLHDGRQLVSRPDVRSTVDAVQQIVPSLISRGFKFQTVSQLLCPTK
jgi:peptidoglycan/xylan/chitin deacetylase (PgdA/CDA1 family)